MFKWIDKTVIEQLKKAVGSYLRAALVAVLTLYISGVTDSETLINAGIAALVAPIIRALNPKDLGYGIEPK
jgi:hypothetical protein